MSALGVNVLLRAIAVSLARDLCQKKRARMARTEDRNRKMLAAYEAGRTMQELGQDYGLSVPSVSHILTAERHRREVSPHPFYRALRDASRSFLDAANAADRESPAQC